MDPTWDSLTFIQMFYLTKMWCSCAKSGNIHIFMGKNHWTTPHFSPGQIIFFGKIPMFFLFHPFWLVKQSVVFAVSRLRWPCRPRPQGAWIAAHLSAIRASRTSPGVLWGTWSQHLGSDWKNMEKLQNFLGDSEVFWHNLVYFLWDIMGSSWFLDIFRPTLGSWMMLETSDDTMGPGSWKLRGESLYHW